MLFYKCIDNEIMKHILKNHEHIHNLCRKYEKEIKISNTGMFHIIFYLFLITFFSQNIYNFFVSNFICEFVNLIYFLIILKMTQYWIHHIIIII